MENIRVCIGSGCHIKGSYDIINQLKRYISLYQLTGEVEIKGAFCFGKCGNGVTVEYMGEYHYLNQTNVEQFVKAIGGNHETV